MEKQTLRFLVGDSVWFKSNGVFQKGYVVQLYPTADYAYTVESETGTRLHAKNDTDGTIKIRSIDAPTPVIPQHTQV